MYLVFFLIWIIFNGQFTLEIAAFGVVVSGLIYWFICRFLGYRPGDDIRLCKRFFLLIHYVVAQCIRSGNGNPEGKYGSL